MWHAILIATGEEKQKFRRLLTIWNDVHQVIYVQDQIEISVLETDAHYDYYREK
jgi:hypothetical protein